MTEAWCVTCKGFGWNYERSGARITCFDCSGDDMRREPPPPSCDDLLRKVRALADEMVAQSAGSHDDDDYAYRDAAARIRRALGDDQ